jgi:hypothetical protein
MTESVLCEYETGACANTDVSEGPNHAGASEHGAGFWLLKSHVSVFPHYEG